VLLPAELPLVPLVVSAAIQQVSFHGRIWDAQATGDREQDPIKEVARIVKQFFPVASAIPNAQVDLTKPNVDAGYLMLLRVLHPEIQEKFTDLLEFIPALVAVAPDRLFLDSVLFYVRVKLSEEDPSVVRLVSRLLDILRGDFSLRRAFYPLLHAWREKSHSPATKAGALARWL